MEEGAPKCKSIKKGAWASPHRFQALEGDLRSGAVQSRAVAKATDTLLAEWMNPSVPDLYLDFYRYWHIGVPLEPVVIYCRSLVAVPLLASVGLGQLLLCRLSGVDQKGAGAWRCP